MAFKDLDWKKVKFADVIELNPRESIKKGTLAKKIGMTNVQEYTKQIKDYTVEEYKGGVKFRQNDTLFARITPCLENGKTSKVDVLEENEIGFGSTEFIVMRAKPNITDDEFVYYLSVWDGVRESAIKSMTGTSGRQRVQISIIKDLTINLPPLNEQKAISKILSSLDNKIKNNTTIIANLEEQAQAVFKSWFVDFEPFQEGEFVESEFGLIPKGFKVGAINDFASISSGKRKGNSEKTEDNIYPIIGATKITGYTKEYSFNERVIITGRVGTLGTLQIYNSKIWPSDNTLILISKQYAFTYFTLKTINFSALNRGSTQPLVSQKDIKNYKVIIPNMEWLSKFENITRSIFNYYWKIEEENKKLVEIRDTVLPKLMIGEIRVQESTEMK